MRSSCGREWHRGSVIPLLYRVTQENSDAGHPIGLYSRTPLKPAPVAPPK